MPRLQILELPEGTGDGRPPFVLVLDQLDRSPLGGVRFPLGGVPLDVVAETIGARAVLTFAETIEIPANEVAAEFRAGLQETVTGLYEETSQSVTDAIASSVDVGYMDAVTDALGLDRLRDWGAIVAAAKQLRLDGASGHHFGGTGYDDPLRCSKCGTERVEWEARRDVPSCATVLLQKGLI